MNACVGNTSLNVEPRSNSNRRTSHTTHHDMRKARPDEGQHESIVKICTVRCTAYVGRKIGTSLFRREEARYSNSTSSADHARACSPPPRSRTAVLYSRRALLFKLLIMMHIKLVRRSAGEEGSGGQRAGAGRPWTRNGCRLPLRFSISGGHHIVARCDSVPYLCMDVCVRSSLK